MLVIGSAEARTAEAGAHVWRQHQAKHTLQPYYATRPICAGWQVAQTEEKRLLEEVLGFFREEQRQKTAQEHQFQELLVRDYIVGLRC